MSKFSIASLLIVSSAFAGAAGIATAKPTPQMAAAKPAATMMTAKKTVAVKKTAVSKPVPALASLPAAPAKMATIRKVSMVHATAPAGHMVTTKTSTGKTVTYNCAKGGNLNKKACK